MNAAVTAAARMKDPAVVLPDAMKGVQGVCRAVYRGVYRGGVCPQILELVRVRAGRINGCGVCVFAGVAGAKGHGA